MAEKLRVYQDGNRFYNDETGDVIFQSSVIVKDYDLRAAEIARKEFLDWIERRQWLFHYEIEWR
jgi:hypothetical protein